MKLKANASGLVERLNSDIKEAVSGLNPATSFLKLAILFGLLLCFITPPLQAPDEQSHFLHAYAVSQGELLATRIGDGYGNNLPKSVGDLLNELNFSKIRFNPNERYHLWWTKAELLRPLNASNQVPTRFDESAAYSPVAYLPQSIGMLFGRLLGLSALTSLYLGRLANLVVWVALIYFAIKLAPFGKWILFVLALAPMSLFLAGSLSPDAMLNGVIFLLIAYFLNLIYEKPRVTKTDLALLLLGFFFIALSKLVYLPIAVILLLVPDRKFEDLLPVGLRSTKVLVVACLVVIAGIFGLAWNRVISPIVTAQLWIDNHFTHTTLAPHAQLTYILTHPFSYLVILLNTFVTNNADGILQSYLGILGWLDAMLPLWVMLLVAFLTVFIFLSEHTRFQISPAVKRTSVALSLLLALAVASALYVYSTTLEYGTIIGIQGRYFIPVVALLIPFFANSVSWFRPPEGLRKGAAYSVTVLVLVATVLVVLFRYYALSA